MHTAATFSVNRFDPLSTIGRLAVARFGTFMPHRRRVLIARGAAATGLAHCTVACKLCPTSARVGANCVCTLGVSVTIVSVFLAFVDISTHFTVAGIPTLAGTGVGASRVRAQGQGVALVSIFFAFVDVGTLLTITSVARFASTGVSTNRIQAGRLCVAFVRTVFTFVDIIALLAVAFET